MSFLPEISFLKPNFLGKKSFLKIQVFSSLFPFAKKIVENFFWFNFYNPVKSIPHSYRSLIFTKIRKKTRSSREKLLIFLDKHCSEKMLQKNWSRKKYSCFARGSEKMKLFAKDIENGLNLARNKRIKTRSCDFLAQNFAKNSQPDPKKLENLRRKSN